MTDYNDGKIHGWNGGDCPVHPDTVVKVWLRDEDWNEGPMEAGFLGWAHDDDNCDIIAFQVDEAYADEELSISDATLIARLRDEQPVTQDFQHTLKCAMMDAAADRIEQLAVTNEQLVATNESLIAENKRLGQQCEGLMQAGMNSGQALIIAENKLAKAVEALEGMCLEFRQYDLPYGSAAYAKATATLAEIKLHSDKFATQKGEGQDGMV